MTTSCFHLSFSRKSFLRPPWPMTVIPALQSMISHRSSGTQGLRSPDLPSVVRGTPGGLSSPSIRSLESAQVFAAQILVAIFVRFMTVMPVRQNASNLMPLQSLQTSQTGQIRKTGKRVSLKSVLSPVPTTTGTTTCSGTAGPGESQNPDRSAVSLRRVHSC